MNFLNELKGKDFFAIYPEMNFVAAMSNLQEDCAAPQILSIRDPFCAKIALKEAKRSATFVTDAAIIACLLKEAKALQVVVLETLLFNNLCTWYW